MTDPRVVRMVTAALAACVVLSLVSSAILGGLSKAVPGDVSDLGKVAIGALGTLLARTGSDPAAPPVSVTVHHPDNTQTTALVEPVDTKEMRS